LNTSATVLKRSSFSADAAPLEVFGVGVLGVGCVAGVGVGLIAGVGVSGVGLLDAAGEAAAAPAVTNEGDAVAAVPEALLAEG